MNKDTEVIHQVLAGDIESFRFLLQRYQMPVIRMIRNLTSDKTSCEDIAQDVFFTVYKKLASFDPARSEFSTWLFTIARNKSINALKKKKALPMSELPEQRDSRNPSDEISEKEIFGELDKKLQNLPAKQRRAFILAEFERLSYAQIAQIEGVRIGTIKSRINRAKDKLRMALKGLVGDIS